MAKPAVESIADIPAATDAQLVELAGYCINTIVENDIDSRETEVPRAVVIIGLIKRLELAEKKITGFL